MILGTVNNNIIFGTSMNYISLDTCVWLALIKEAPQDDGVFEEICYFIEEGHLKHITPENVITEWDRNKKAESDKHITSLHDSYKKAITSLDRAVLAAYEPKNTEKIINSRVARVDTILKTYSEVAPHNDSILLEASKRSLECFAPCHIKDSYRDAVNILTLVHYLKNKGYSNCIYSTKNSTDFSEDKKLKQHELHPHLIPVFNEANLRYVFCEDMVLAGKLMNILRKEWSLNGFQNFLKEKKKKENESVLAEKKEAGMGQSDSKDYLDDISYIDLILSRKERTALDEEILRMLFKKDQRYSDYFLKNVLP